MNIFLFVELADPMGHELSKIVKRWKHENQRPEPSEISSPARKFLLIFISFHFVDVF